MADYLEHGPRHTPGGSDPIPYPGLPVGMVRRTGTATISASTSTALTWQQSAISDPSFFAWTSGTNLQVLQTGIYMAWFFIGPDSDWPAAGASYIDWQIDASGSGNFAIAPGPGLLPIGSHPGIDLYSPSFFTAGTSSVSFLHISNPTSSLTGVVDNETLSSFVVGVGAALVVYRLCEVMDFA